jgi:hypothetical protein
MCGLEQNSEPLVEINGKLGKSTPNASRLECIEAKEGYEQDENGMERQNRTRRRCMLD